MDNEKQEAKTEGNETEKKRLRTGMLIAFGMLVVFALAGTIMRTVYPVYELAISLGTLCLIGLSLGAAYALRSRIIQLSPVVTEQAVVDVKWKSDGSARTPGYCYVRFETGSGKLITFMNNRLYKAVNMGDRGRLTYQGDAFKSFDVETASPESEDTV